MNPVVVPLDGDAGNASILERLQGFDGAGKGARQDLADVKQVTADQHELDSGRRAEGIFFSLISFAGKAASGAGSLVAGVTLDVIAWPAGAAQAGAAAVPAETIRALGIVYGPVVAAFAVAEPGANTTAVERALRARAEQHLASYKRPRVYHFMDELPRNAMGKIDRSALRARV